MVLNRESREESLSNMPPVTRRRFLVASGLAISAGSLSPLLRQRAAIAHEDTVCPCASIWAAAYVSGRYVALTGEIDTGSVAMHELRIDQAGEVDLGSRIPANLPISFVPATVHGDGQRLLVGGAMVEEIDRLRVDYRIDGIHPDDLRDLLRYSTSPTDGVVEVPVYTYRPALVEVNGSTLASEFQFGDAARFAWGMVTNIIGTVGAGISVLIEGSDSPEQAYGDRVVVAESLDGGATWVGDVIATSLGEASPATLAAAGNSLVAIIVDQDDNRTIAQRGLSGGPPWDSIPGEKGGVVLGAVSGRNSDIVIFDVDNGTVRRQEYNTTTRAWTTPVSVAQISGQAIHAAVTIGGAPGEWIAVGEQNARIVNEAA